MTDVETKASAVFLCGNVSSGCDIPTNDNPVFMVDSVFHGQTVTVYSCHLVISWLGQFMEMCSLSVGYCNYSANSRTSSFFQIKVVHYSITLYIHIF